MLFRRLYEPKLMPGNAHVGAMDQAVHQAMKVIDDDYFFVGTTELLTLSLQVTHARTHRHTLHTHCTHIAHTKGEIQHAREHTL